ncbi:Lysyl oxidase like protein 2B [Melipona quadrifasciata]|uniref:protein-lysine 6-oxidase n=1 Tax=Melipona quadrifasciata TaxID=166423 RepID=A0A0N0U4V5_9HYME|nr:Lysyl oxidase like protein 2B [Melipona quadrifasciata]
MRSKMNWKVLVVGFLMTLTLVDVRAASNSTLNKVREKKARIVEKLKRDFRKLKKQDGAVKLVGGGNGEHEGNNKCFEFESFVWQVPPATARNVEILHDGKWGSVCDDEWDYLEANVVCRQLGFDGAIKPTSNGHFGQARRRYWMDNVYCDGSEDELSKCRFDGWGASDCGGGEAAGVICTRDQQDRENEVAIRLVGGRVYSEGRVEVKLGNSVCGDGWSLFEAAVVCRQLGLGYASDAVQTNFFGGQRTPVAISGVQCHGDEDGFIDCLHDKLLDCPGSVENVASVVCLRDMPDLVFDHIELMRTAHLEDRQLYWLQCAMEENCVASQAYKTQKESDNWHLETRRLLRFTARILNAGTADFRPSVPKHLWEWHMCHMHYHSMEVFATFDVLDQNGTRLAEGHKASFCLEDNQCLPGVEPRYKCANYGDQGISVNCSDVYKHNIDCQWVDISELAPGEYIFKVAVNPEFKVGEMSFDNNAAICRLLYTESFAAVHSCVMGRP